MRKVFAWLGAAALFISMSRAEAANDVLKPYVVMILDTSGSMAAATGSGPSSCGKRDTRLNHAVCAINSIVNSYGEMVFSLGRFRENVVGPAGVQASCDANGDQEGNVLNSSPNPSGGDVCNTEGPYCGDCDPSSGTERSCAVSGDCKSTVCQSIVGETLCNDGLDNDSDGRIDDGCPVAGGNGAETGVNCFNNVDNDSDGVINDGCPAQGKCSVSVYSCKNSDNGFEVLTPLVDGNNAEAAEFTDGTCDVCSVATTVGVNPEIWGVSQNTYTPLSSSMKGAQEYWEGTERASDNQIIWPSTSLGYDPINRDPSAHVFLAANDAVGCNADAASCTAFNPEVGADCNNNIDDDSDGRVNDGCPQITGTAETQCADNETACTGDTADNDGDGRVNDGCPAVVTAEASCNDNLDNDNDGTINDGCAAVGNDNDGDGTVNDGCQAWCLGPNCCCATQCRPYITILLTDGDETCTNFANTRASAADLSRVTPRNDNQAISTIQRTNNVVSLTTAVAHPFKVGDQISIFGTGLSGFLGTTFIVTAATATTLTYTHNAGNLGPVTNAGNVLAFANVRHSASRYAYDIQVKPIGFGIGVGYQPIEDIAHDGGAPDVPGVLEGYYAQDEADLELAISQILADSVRAESCNDRDDDCDVRIDEDFPTKGNVCTVGVGACVRNGTLVCQAGQLACSVTAGTGSPEVCNLIDDNCNGLVDEGLNCNVCVPTAEICDGADNNCDGVADRTCVCNGGTRAGQTCSPTNGNGDCPGGSCPLASACTPITRSCGIGVCPGTETCTGPNTYTGCTAVQQELVETLCDGIDNDCDGVCDGFTRDCSQQGGACNVNLTNSCPATDSFGHPSNPRNSQPDTAETACADAIDNDKDGLVNDGCPPNGAPETGANCANATDNDGDSSVNDGCPVPTLPIAQNICRPGTRSCDVDVNCSPGNQFGACSGETVACGPDAAPGSGCDTCNNQDDDCDNAIDEDFVDADCSTNCGIGRTICQNGNIVCNSMAAIGDATCNNIDDDCDGKTDEDWGDPIGPGAPPVACKNDDGNTAMCDPCTMNSMGDPVCNGITKCVNGVELCDGGPVGIEVCNCLDDDCDGNVDEDPNPGDPNVNLCPGQATCANCQCAFGCAQGEFPCPLGKKCDTSDRCSQSSTTPGTTCTVPGDCTNGTCDDAAFCVNDPCFNVTCQPVNGNQQTCIPKPAFPNEPQCVDVCSLVNNGDNTDGYPACSPGLVCFGPAGECRPDTCLTFPDRCTANENCIDGQCVSNPCQGVTCDTGTYCLGGACLASCADVTCATGQRCRLGACETDPCGKVCPFGQACNDTTGECIEDPCKFRQCPAGQWCNPNVGQCENDACQVNDIDCPGSGEVCRGGTCVDPTDDVTVDGGGAHVTVGGGGGCNTSGSGNGLLLVLGALGLLISRRRRSVGGAL